MPSGRWPRRSTPFATRRSAALESLDMDIRRALEWIHHDRHEHWNHEVRRGWERITAGPRAAPAGDDGPPHRRTRSGLHRREESPGPSKAAAGDCPGEGRSGTALCPGDRPRRWMTTGGADAAFQLAGIGGPQGPGGLAADDGQPGELSGPAAAGGGAEQRARAGEKAEKGRRGEGEKASRRRLCYASRNIGKPRFATLIL